MSDNARFGVLVLAVALAVGLVVWLTYGGPNPSSTGEPGAPDVEVATQAADDTPPPEVESSTETPSETQSAAATSRHQSTFERKASLPTGPGRVRGEVRWKDDGGPAAGADVTVELIIRDPATGMPEGDRVIWTTTTDADGRFSVQRLPIANLGGDGNESYSVVAAKGQAAGTSGTRLTDDEPDGWVEIELVECGTISGLVVNASEEPVAGAAVFPGEGKKNDARVYANSLALRVVTDADGHFDLAYLPDAEWKLVVQAEGYATKESDPFPVDTNDVEIVVTEGGTVSGMVTQAESGKPVADMEVVASGSRWMTRTATTDENGAFTIPTLADGDYSINIKDDEQILLGETPRVTVSHETAVDNVTLKIATGGVVAGRVYDSETGEAVPDVRISTRNHDPSRQGVSDASGHYRVTGLSEGSLTLRRRWKEGYRHGEDRENKTVNVKLGQQLDGIDFPILKGRTLRGIVVDTKERPIPQVNVESQAMDDSGEGESVTTKDDGTFEHRGFSEGARVRITAQRKGFTAEPIDGLVVGPDGLDDVKIVMEPGASIAGTVVDTHGRPLGNVYVRSQSDGSSGSSGTTDADGQFKLEGLAAGTYSFFLRKSDDYYRNDNPTAETATVSKGQELTGVRLVYDEAEKGLTISGRILNKQREPIKDASINAHAMGGVSSWGYARSGDDGRYEIAGLKDGQHMVMVNHGSYSQAQLEGVAAGAKNVDFVLESTGSIEGKVVDARNGRPIAAFQLAHIRGAMQRLSPFNVLQFTSYFDEDGNFKLSKVDAGDATIVARAEGYAQAMEVVNGIRAGDTVTGVVLRLSPGGSIDGIVVDPQGAPMSSVSIMIGDDPGNEWARQQGTVATTDGSGRFHVDSLTPGVVKLSAYHPDYPPATVDVNVAAERSTEVEIMLSAGGTIEGTVRRGGQPLAGQNVSAHPTGGGGRSQNATTDERGFYTLSGLGAGEYAVMANIHSSTGGNRYMNRTAQVEVDMTTQVDFEFADDNGVVEGVVTRGGQPVSQGSVSASINSEGVMQAINAQTGADGSYRLEGLPSGTVNIRVVIPQQGSVITRIAPVQVVAGRTTRHDFDVEAGSNAVGSVSGIRDGEVAYVVALQGETSIDTVNRNFFWGIQDRLAGQAQIGSDGRFQVPGLADGTYTLVAIAFDPQAGQSAMDNARSASATVTVAGRDASADLTLH